jgi:hypothetical protein
MIGGGLIGDRLISGGLIGGLILGVVSVLCLCLYNAAVYGLKDKVKMAKGLPNEGIRLSRRLYRAHEHNDFREV